MSGKGVRDMAEPRKPKSTDANTEDSTSPAEVPSELAPIAGAARAAGAPPLDGEEGVSVTMRRAFVPSTADQALWTAIRSSADALSFRQYRRFIDAILCGEGDEDDVQAFNNLRALKSLPFPDVEPYRLLKVATEVFMNIHCGVVLPPRGRGTSLEDADFTELGRPRREQELRRLGSTETVDAIAGVLQGMWNPFLQPIDGQKTIPYLQLIRQRLGDVQLVADDGEERIQLGRDCMGILRTKMTRPCFLELIWSYWHEEGMLVQTINAISWRFQNRHGPAQHDPLANLEIDPLRPLNNFLWGYIQDDQHRLTVPRRAYEYDHHYGLTLLGKAVPSVRGADPRSRFLEAFHHLLYVCSIFFKEDDDTTVVADGFPVLNALKEVHLLLTEGAHNQYGDLPWTARQEMLMQEWLLARPEFREFLPRRIMVDYPEEWMDSVETMKTLQGWRSSSVLHFRDLGVFGEQVLLGVRFGAWPSVIESQQAANWARYWRPEIQGYIHAYRAVSGMDLSERVDATMPSVLLRQRLTRATAARPGPRPARAQPRPAPVVQVPVASELQEWGEIGT
jgi:hypothetical protein